MYEASRGLGAAMRDVRARRVVSVVFKKAPSLPHMPRWLGFLRSGVHDRTIYTRVEHSRFPSCICYSIPSLPCDVPCDRLATCLATCTILQYIAIEMLATSMSSSSVAALMTVLLLAMVCCLGSAAAELDLPVCAPPLISRRLVDVPLRPRVLPYL